MTAHLTGAPPRSGRAAASYLLGVDRPDLPGHAAVGVADDDAELAGRRVVGLDLEVALRQVEVVHGAARGEPGDVVVDVVGVDRERDLDQLSDDELGVAGRLAVDGDA